MSPASRKIVTETAVWWSVCIGLLFISALIAGLGGIWAENAGVLPAAFCLLFPVIIGGRLRIPPEDWGLTLRPFLRSITVTLLACTVVFPFYIAGYEVWARVVQGQPFLGIRFAVPSLWWLVNLLFVQVVAVALPEEVFYRGWMQSRLAGLFKSRFVVAGVPIGWHVVVTAALFAISHLVLHPSPARLAVFFPGLLFGWLRERTGSVVASISFHALCNILLAVLQNVH